MYSHRTAIHHYSQAAVIAGQCDFAAIAGCYATFGASFWKVSALVGDAQDMDAVRARVHQSTGAFRDVTALCRYSRPIYSNNVQQCLPFHSTSVLIFHYTIVT
jgi:hypothetical protein